MLHIKFKSDVFHVNSSSFSDLSPVAASLLHNARGSKLCVPDTPQNAHFNVLMRYLKNGDSVIRESSIPLLTISISWNCDALIDRIQEISLSIGNKRLIISEIATAHAMGHQLLQCESYVASNFNDFVSEAKDRMVTLEIDLLKRILPWYLEPSIDFNKVVDFLLLVLERRGKEASCLFQYVNFEQVKFGKITALLQHSTLDTRYLVTQMGAMMARCDIEASLLEERRRKSEELVQAHENARTVALQHYAEAESRLNSLQQQLLIANSSSELYREICDFELRDGTDELLRLKYEKHLRSSGDCNK